MKTLMDISAILKLKEQGKSNRAISLILKIIGITDITTSINVLALDKQNIEYATIIEKYNSLSN